MTATAGAPAWSSAGVNVRPSAGADAEHVEEAGRHARARQLLRALAVGGVEPLVGDRRQAAEHRVARRELDERRVRERAVDDRALRVRPRQDEQAAGSLNGSGRSSAASTMLKTAVLAPMPMATIATATKRELARLQQRSECVSHDLITAHPFRGGSDDIPLTRGGVRAREAARGKRRQVESADRVRRSRRRESGRRRANAESRGR